MTRFQVWLNGISLQDVAPSIRITDVRELAPDQRIATAARASGDGMRLLHRARQSLSVAVDFTIREYSPARRKAALAAVLGWASQGGWLTLGDRPGQRLHVTAESLPHMESALGWTEELSLGFTAYESPYWEEIAPTRFPAGRKILLPGNAPTAPADFLWTAPGGSISLRIETPLSCMLLDGLPTVSGQQLALTHAAGVPVITLDGQDVLAYRTPDSSDDLLLPCGEASTVAVFCNGVSVGDCTVTARGRWL